MKGFKRFSSSHLLRLTAFLVIVSCLLLGNTLQATAIENSDQTKKQEIIDLIVNHHVSGMGKDQLDTKDIDTIVASLNDPYTQYFTPDEWKKFLNALENNYTGIGIRVGSDETGFFVNEVFTGTPAAEVGMQEGDYIVAVNGTSTKGKTTDELISEITGIEGTKVKVKVERDGDKIDFTLTRKQIHIPAITSRLLDNGIGYIRISSFSSDADELFSEQVDAMKKKGMTSFVLDLRDNPGGLLDTAGNMASRFIKKGNLILTRDRTKVDKPYPLKGKDTLDMPVVVLVNEFSASASEVLSGALQDYKLAKLVGSNTFGKGSVQSLYELNSGGVLKLTIQEYLTPLGNAVNKVGLKPDIEVIGSTPQLLTALQTAGDINLNLTLSKKGLTINGEAFSDSFKVIRENGMTFVPSRVLAAVVEGEVSWNGKNRSIVIHANNKDIEYSVNSEGVLLDKGISYIALNRFQTQFRNLAWSDQNDTLSLIENGR